MNKMRESKIRRVLAMLMAVVLIAGMLPEQWILPVTAATEEYPETLTIKVTDEGAAVTGAAVSATNGIVTLMANGVTNQSGVATISDVTGATDFGGNNEFTISIATVANGIFTFDQTIVPGSVEHIDFDIKVTASGIISDGTSPIAGAAVIAGSLSTESASDGSFEIAVYKNETDTIKVSHPDYIGNSADLILGPGNNLILTDKIADSGFAFATLSPDNIQFSEGGNYTNIANGGTGTGAVTYAIASGDAATIDSVSGTLTFVHEGTVKVTATKAADAAYKSIQTSYTLTITTAEDDNFAFATPNPEALIFGETGTYTNIAYGGKGTGVITYRIISGADTANIDEASGKLTLLKSGTVIVKATRAADNKYSTISATYTITINKAEQTGFRFKETSPLDMEIAEGTYINQAIGGQSTKDVEYEIISGSQYASIDAASGEVTFIAPGTITVGATLPGGEAYDSVMATYRLTITSSPRTGFYFETTQPSNIIYSKNGQYTNAAKGGDTAEEPIYEITVGGEAASIDPVTGTLTLIKAGTVTVKATKPGDGVYSPVEIYYTVTIDKAEQTGFAFEKKTPEDIAYAENYIYRNSAGGGQSEETIFYEITSGDAQNGGPVSIEDTSGDLTIIRLGTVVIRATRSGNDCYKPVSTSYTIVIGKAEQTDFTFAETTPSITYNENGNEFQATASGGQTLGEVTYEIIDQPSDAAEYVAAIEPNSGLLTILKAGQVTVKATKPGDEKYLPAEAICILTINKAEQVIAFEKNGAIEIIYGNSFSNTVSNIPNLPAADGFGYGLGDITYEIIDVDNTNVATIDSTSGKLTFLDSGVGTIEVTAKKAADDCYKEATASYTLTVSYMDIPENSYILSGNQLDPSEGWYTGDVTITPKEGYEISYSNDLAGNTWTESLVVEEGVNSLEVYLRKEAVDDESYDITDVINIPEIKIDKTAPTELGISYTQPLWTKVLNAVTFGYYQSDVTVTITAMDDTSTVSYFDWSYTREIGVSSAKNVENKGGRISSADIDFSYGIDKKTATASFTLTATESEQYRGNVQFEAVDVAGNRSNIHDGRTVDETETIGIDDHVVVVDSISPTREVTYSTPKQIVDNEENSNHTLYYDDDVTAIFKITEANFDAEDVRIYINETEIDSIHWVQDIDGTGFEDEWTGTTTISGEGDYIVTMDYIDHSQNEMEGYTSEKIVIDKTDPEVSVSYSLDNIIKTVDGRNYYDTVQTATIIVTEHNFRASDIKATVTALDAAGADIKEIESITKLAESLCVDSNWTHDGDIHIANISYSIDANYIFDIEYEDLALRTIAEYDPDLFTIDTTPPENLTVSYSGSVFETIIKAITFGYYQSDVTVTMTAMDDITNVEYFEWEYIRETGGSTIHNVESEAAQISFDTERFSYEGDNKTATVSFTLTATEYEQYRGFIQFTATDKLGNKSTVHDGRTIQDENSSEEIDNHIIVVDNISPLRTITYSEPVRILDAATNNTKDSFEENSNSILYYNSDVTLTFMITEANFYSEDVKIMVNGNRVEPTEIEWSQTGDDYTGYITLSNEGEYCVTMSYHDRSNNYVKKAEDADITDAVQVDSRTGGDIIAFTSETIIIDKTAPSVSVTYNPDEIIREEDGVTYYDAVQIATIVVTEQNFRADEIVAAITARDVKGAEVTVQDYEAYLSNRSNWTHNGNQHTAQITYSADANYIFTIAYEDLASNKLPTYTPDVFTVDTAAPVNLTISYTPSVFETIIKTITFGYYQAPLTVTISADDNTAGIYRFKYSYINSTGVSAVNAELIDEAISKANITYANSGKTAKATFRIPQSALTGKNQFNGNVKFTAYDRSENNNAKSDTGHRIVVDSISPTRTVSYTEPKQIVDSTTLLTKNSYEENSNATLYYDGDITATFKINEANFYAEDVVIKISKDNGTAYKQAPGNWSQNGDEWTGSITLSGDGDYIITVQYTDRSTNKMVDYQSEKLVIDTINPVISVTYSPNKAIAGLDGRTYYDAVQTAVITVKEHNFRADDISAAITAKDVTSANVPVSDFAQYLSNRNNWTKSGDTYTATITYATDANYTFDIDYRDLALNNIANYTEDVFTVDTTAPTNLTVSKSSSVFGTILERITFGYYNAQTTVTISADDSISGVGHFMYSYLNSAGVSSVNAELVNAAITNADITYSNGGRTATARFSIPRSILGSNNQFNGTVEFTAYDRSENNTRKADTERIVVDNISPTATITYNDPVQNVNDISYYAGDVTATLVINEANFYSAEVSVTITKDGGEAYAVMPTWDSGNIDTHTGIINLTEDGDYIINITYQDRSNNKMENYTSNQLTIDTVMPELKVEGIANNTANNGETIGFVITASDINFDTSQFTPELTAVTMDKNGIFKEISIQMGDMITVMDGSVYAYSVDNLDADGIYSLSCTITDMSGNTSSELSIADSNDTLVEEIAFSVNRAGSTFMLDDNSDKLVETYYVQSVYNDIGVIETNVDPLQSYNVTVNGEVLLENSDYIVTKTGSNNEWSKYTYAINKSLFEEEGKYSVIVSSTDKAENMAYSDIKSAEANFVVDRTPPDLTISGLESNGRYQVENQTVTIIPKDDGGKLNSLKVIITDNNDNPITDSNGEDISVPVDLSGDELAETLESSSDMITFEIPSGLNMNVQIICNDCAQDDEGNTNEYNNTFENVTVSTNMLVIFYANKSLFIGSIVGVSLLILGLFILIYLKKRKKKLNQKRQRN